MTSRVEELSPRQKDVLRVVLSSLDQYGVPPTYREIGDALGIASTNGVADHIKALIKKGYLTAVRGKGASRGLKPTPLAKRSRRGAVVEVSVLHKGASWPLTLSDYEDTLLIDRHLLPKGALVARRSEGRVTVARAREMSGRGDPLLLPTKAGGFIQIGPVVLVIEPR